MATKCMSCGGSKMKKMNTGGASGDKCKFPLCAKYEGSSFVGCLPCGAGVKAGLATSIGGVTAGITKMASDFSKKRKAVSAIKESNPGMTRKEARNKLNNPIPEEKRGGAVKKKKYAMGGTTGGYAPAQKGGDNTKNGIYGVPNAGRTDALGFKKGGITKMNDGGSKTRKNVITGRTRVTTPYAVGASSKGTVAPKDYSTGTKTEVFGKNGNLIKTKYKHRGTGKYDTEGSKYPYNFVREEEKPGGEKKEKYPILPSFLQPADKLKKGGATKAKKFAALAPPYNKATFADRIVGAKKKVVKKKK